MNSILIIFLAFLILFILNNIINNRIGINDVINKQIKSNLETAMNTVKTKQDNINNTIKEKSKIKTEFKDPFYKFPDPMLSNISHPLSRGFKPMYEQLNEGTPDMSDLEIVRTSYLDYYIRNPKVFNPMPVRKDTMDADPGDYTLQGIARVDLDEDKNEMTSDTYLTKYPKFASSDLSNELTNVGYFFDNNDNNDYINLQNRILPSSCKLEGDQLSCELNGALQPIPDKLMKNNSAVLNSIGVIIDNEELVKSTDGYSVGTVDGGEYKIWNYPNEKPMNGGVDFDNVYASNPLGYNETCMSVTDNLNCSACAI